MSSKKHTLFSQLSVKLHGWLDPRRLEMARDQDCNRVGLLPTAGRDSWEMDTRSWKCKQTQGKLHRKVCDVWLAKQPEMGSLFLSLPPEECGEV